VVPDLGLTINPHKISHMITFETHATIDGIDDVEISVTARVMEDDDGSQPYRQTFPLTAEILAVTETSNGDAVAIDDDLYEQLVDEAVTNAEAEADYAASEGWWIS